MARYIDADVLRIEMEDLYEHHIEMRNFSADGAVADCLTMLNNAPTADVVEVKHGEWKNVVVYNDTCIATCSNCRQQIVERECNATAFKLENEFCRKCGAKMDGQRK